MNCRIAHMSTNTITITTTTTTSIPSIHIINMSTNFIDLSVGKSVSDFSIQS